MTKRTGLELLRAIAGGTLPQAPISATLNFRIVALGSAVMSTLDADTSYTTTQLSIYLTGSIDAHTGPVLAEGRIVQRGKRVATAEARLTDERGRLLAHGTTSCLLIERRTA